MYCSVDYKIDYRFPMLEPVQTGSCVDSACFGDGLATLPGRVA